MTIAGCALSALNAVLAHRDMLVCVWFVVRDLVAVAPAWGEARQAPVYGAWALAFALAGLVVYFAALMCTHLAAFRTATNMRKAALEHLAKVPLGYFSVRSTGELRRVIEGSTGLTEGVLAHRIPDFVGALVTPVGLPSSSMFVFDWVMASMCLIPVLASPSACVPHDGRRPERQGRRGGNSNAMQFMVNCQKRARQDEQGRRGYVRGIPVVKVFQQTVHSFRAFRESIVASCDFATAYVKLCEGPQVAQLVAINATFFVLVPAGILLAGAAGDFGAFLTNFLFYVIFSALTTMMMSKIMYSSQAVTEAQDAVSRIDGIPVGAAHGRVDSCAGAPADDAIDFDHVTFSYPGADAPALEDVVLHVPSGATVALVGPSGGGKTTAASLVPRFWDASAGRVLVGGVDVRSIPQAELASAWPSCSRTTSCSSRACWRNSRAARPEATREEVEAAAHAAQCDDIVAKLPQGLDTVVGARGVYLSGGECQRIALARAILKDAPIVVLDEATAFADPENEALIQRALGVLCAGKTVLMIAHRLSTVAGADAIYVLDGGRLAEQGPTPSWWRRAACTRAYGPTIEPRRNGASERRAAMLRDSLGLTDVGEELQARRVLLHAGEPRAHTRSASCSCW